MAQMKVMTIIGTRPELIKTTAFIRELNKQGIDNVVVNTQQHKEMTEKIAKELKINFDYKLNVMKKHQSPSYVIALILMKLEEVIAKEKPTVIAVVGDTATSMAGALAAYHNKIEILHIEAGVRTYNKYNAFPEEGYRNMIDHISDIRTCQSQDDLMKLRIENLDGLVTGNNSLDLLNEYTTKESKNQVLITMHRREDWGVPIDNVCYLIKELALKYKDTKFIYVLHPNPTLKIHVEKILSKIPNVYLFKDMSFYDFIDIMSESKLVMTDSGGILQEAIFLRKPIVYLRNKSEYSDIFDNDLLYETGKDCEFIREAVEKILKLDSPKLRKITIFGDGTSGKTTVQCLL